MSQYVEYIQLIKTSFGRTQFGRPLGHKVCDLTSLYVCQKKFQNRLCKKALKIRVKLQDQTYIKCM